MASLGDLQTQSDLAEKVVYLRWGLRKRPLNASNGKFHLDEVLATAYEKYIPMLI